MARKAGTRTSRGLRRLVRTAAYLLYLAAFVLVVAYVFFWWPFVAELRQAKPRSLKPPPYVDAATMRRLGSLRADRTSSFPRFEPAKASGVIRLCALGDSFTYGDEVADGHDYPALLQRLFEERGVDNVEVINFGNPWYGFHQAFITWTDIARRFECDVVLLGPDCFQPDRDTTFNHTNLGEPYYLHARFVLDGGDDVRLIEVLGRGSSERFEDYFGFFPSWRYLRYDRNPPAILQSVVGRGRTIANPFYYLDTRPEVEAYATYEVLLRRLAAEGVQIILLHTLDSIVEIGRRIGAPNLAASTLYRDGRYPYVAPGGHYSSFGNRLVAEHFAAPLLAGGGSATGLDFQDVATQGAELQPADERLPLSAFDRIELRIADEAAGVFAVASRDPALRTGAADALSGSTTPALLAFSSAGVTLVDAGFATIAQPRLLEDELSVEVRCSAASQTRKFGRPRWPDGRVHLAAIEVEGLSFEGGGFVYQGTWPLPTTICEPLEVTVSLGATPVLVGAARYWPVRLDPTGGSVWNFRVGEGQYVAPENLGDSGGVILALHHARQGTIEVPMATWRKRSEPIPRPDRPLAKQLEITGGKLKLKQE